MKNRIKKTSGSLILVIALSLVAGMSVNSYASDKTYYLPTNIKEYTLRQDDDENIIKDSWHCTRNETFKYNKRGHLIKGVYSRHSKKY